MEKGGDTQNNNQEEVHDVNKVLISSIHKSKGREWDNIFLFDLHNKNKIASGQTTNRIEPPSEEERRVAYVALTRAKLNLMVTARREPLSPFINEAFVPSSYLKQTDPLRAIANDISEIKYKISRKKKDLANLKSASLLKRFFIGLRKEKDFFAEIDRIQESISTMETKKNSLENTSTNMEMIYQKNSANGMSADSNNNCEFPL